MGELALTTALPPRSPVLCSGNPIGSYSWLRGFFSCAGSNFESRCLCSSSCWCLDTHSKETLSSVRTLLRVSRRGKPSLGPYCIPAAIFVSFLVMLTEYGVHTYICNPHCELHMWDQIVILIQADPGRNRVRGYRVCACHGLCIRPHDQQNLLVLGPCALTTMYLVINSVMGFRTREESLTNPSSRKLYALLVPDSVSGPRLGYGRGAAAAPVQRTT